MRPLVVGVVSPVLQHHSHFLQAEEQLTVEELGPKAGMKAFDMAILPGRAWLDAGTAHRGFLQSGLNPAGHELRAVVAAQPLRIRPMVANSSSWQSWTRDRQELRATVAALPLRLAPVVTVGPLGCRLRASREGSVRPIAAPGHSDGSHGLRLPFSKKGCQRRPTSKQRTS